MESYPTSFLQEKVRFSWIGSSNKKWASVFDMGSSMSDPDLEIDVALHRPSSSLHLHRPASHPPSASHPSPPHTPSRPPGMTKKKPRVIWKLECVDKTFLEACIHEITTNGREGSRLKRCSWKVVAEKLKNEHSFIVDHKQMRNRYDYLKSKYGAWLKLKNKIGNPYNPVTNTFNMSDEKWEAEAKLNKFVEKLRNAPLPCPDLCTKLFEGVTATGIHSWGPSSTIPHPTEGFSEHDVDDVQYTHMETDLPPVSEESSGRSKRKASIKSSKEARRKTLDDELSEVGKEIINVAKMLMDKNNIDNDMDACMKKLEEMEWDVEDPRYNTALLLFGESADIRKVWLRLKPVSCESWVKNAGRKFGLFD